MTDTIDSGNRYRVSSKFIIVKIFLGFALFACIYSWCSDIYNNSFRESSVAQLIGTVALTAILYLLSKIKTIEYDDVSCRLYVYSSKKQLEIEIPVEKIDKILYSVIGPGRVLYSYVIVYRDFQDQTKTVRLFPIPFNNDIDTIISDTKLRNPNLVTRNWSFGVNEFFD